MGTVGVLFSSVGVVIGSGWLLGALNASKIAGPAALIAWLIGGAAMAVLAINVAELGGMYHVAGGEVRFAHIAFGSLSGYALGWFSFIAGCTTAPIETEAMMTYASGYVPGIVDAQGVLTAPVGYIVAGVVLLVFTIVNILGVRWMSEVNKYAVWWKLAIPTLAIVAVMIVGFRGNFFVGNDTGGFMPFGMHGVLEAVTAGGIVFAYSGFDSAVAFGAESKNPGRNIPIAVVGAMLIGLVLYMMLEVAFLGALRPHDLLHGWANLTLSSNIAGPYAAIATGLGLGWLAFVLYIDAIVSPGGTGLIAIGINARVVFALARNRYIPAFFGYLNGRGTPIVAIVLTVLVGLFVFAPFPSWGELVGFASSAGVIVIAMLPPAVEALRRTDPDRPRPFKLPFVRVVAPAGFIIANELILFSGFGVVWKLILAIIIGFLLLLAGTYTRPPSQRAHLDLVHSIWIAPWLIGLAIISFLASFPAAAPDPNTIPFTTIQGGTGKILPFGIDMIVLAVFSLIIYYIALASKLSAAETQQYIADFSAEATQDLDPEQTPVA
ncbi:MAG: APC family permease [Candidatus Dormibacteraceae bacterium]